MDLSGSGFRKALCQAQELMEDVFPACLEVEGRKMRCVSSGASLEEERELGGYAPEGRWLVRVSKRNLRKAPAVNTLVKLDGEELRVARVMARNWEVAWTLELEPKRKG